jgi:hypothetical protein
VIVLPSCCSPTDGDERRIHHVEPADTPWWPQAERRLRRRGQAGVVHAADLHEAVLLEIEEMEATFCFVGRRGLPPPARGVTVPEIVPASIKNYPSPANSSQLQVSENSGSTRVTRGF